MLWIRNHNAGLLQFSKRNNLYVVVSCAKSQKVSKGYFVETVDATSSLWVEVDIHFLFDPPGPICWQLCPLGKCRPSYIIVFVGLFFVRCLFLHNESWCKLDIL